MIDALLNDNAVWFTVPAVLGTLFFLLRLGLAAVGGAEGADVDAGADFDAGGDFAGDLDVGDLADGDAALDANHGDPGDAIKLLSVQSIAAFMMGFGWGGIAGLLAFDWTWGASLLFGLGCGVGMMWILALMLKGMHDLQSSGNLAANAAVGREASVYVTVPAAGGGLGQVRVVMNGRERIYNAITEGETIPRAGRVRVVRVEGGNTLVVREV